MGQLIDALLALSRVSRAELAHELVNLTDIAAGVVAQLRAGDLGRTVEVVVADRLHAHGDAQLLRALMENLIGNAWKFTSKREVGRIEVGCEGQDGERTYLVRDNGAGFDMAYAQKLFTPFQRLHKDTEFAARGSGSRPSSASFAVTVVGSGPKGRSVSARRSISRSMDHTGAQNEQR